MPLELQLAVLFVTGIIIGILSGITGGGGGLITTPLLIALGLPPQVAVGTMKLSGLGTSLGGLSVFWKSGKIRMDIARVIIPFAVVIAIIAPYIAIAIDPDVFQKLIGVSLLIAAPALMIRGKLLPSKRRRIAGYSIYAALLVFMAVFSSGIGMFGVIVLVVFLGLTPIEANATKRIVTATMVPITFLGFLLVGLVSLPHGLTLLVSNFIGSHIGSKLALQKGEIFVTYVVIVVAVVSGIWLLLS